MPMSRPSRILLLLVIDIVFFFTELVVGYCVGSLALIADSFHMLNDVLSLSIALCAIKMANRNKVNARYSYGWQRVEILAALVNGIFLLALCFSICLEAMQRFVSIQKIQKPMLVVIVGCLGLASNILGLFIFHEHGNGNVDRLEDLTTNTSKDFVGATRTRVSSVIGPARMDSISSSYGHAAALPGTAVNMQVLELRNIDSRLQHTTSQHASHGDLGVNVKVASLISESDVPRQGQEHIISGQSPVSLSPRAQDARTSPRVTGSSADHVHGHGSMNMRAIVIHVFGDALGNIGIIVAGLVIWLTTWSFKFYCDPAISLVIAVIIFSTALPLVRSTSVILLQGVPATVSVEDVRDAILRIEGVLSVHELHIWQLSERKIVASMHVTASRNHDFMCIAVDIREALHKRGIHSSTIQPEYNASEEELTLTEKAAEASHNSSLCLINCPSVGVRCKPEDTCCPSTISGV